MVKIDKKLHKMKDSKHIRTSRTGMHQNGAKGPRESSKGQEKGRL